MPESITRDTAVHLVLEGRVAVLDEGGIEQARAALEEFLAEARSYYEAPGGIRMTLLWDAQDPTRFREVFAYRTTRDAETDDERVATDPTMKGLLARWRSLLDGEPQVSRWYAAALP